MKPLSHFVDNDLDVNMDWFGDIFLGEVFWDSDQMIFARYVRSEVKFQGQSTGLGRFVF